MKQGKKCAFRQWWISASVSAIAVLLLLVFLVSEVRHHLSDRPDHLSAFWRACWLFSACVLLFVGAALRKKQKPDSKALLGATLLSFGLYLYLLANFTLLDAALGRWGESVYAAQENRRRYYMEHFVNFKPLYSIWEVYIKGFWNGYVHAYYVVLNLLGNLCAFMPFAIFLPALFRAQRRRLVFLATMLGAVVAVESLQFLLMVGSCDVDDLILNAGGAMIAFEILRIPLLRKRLCVLDV